MKLPFLLWRINSPSINVLKHFSFSVLAPVKMTAIFVVIKYILPIWLIYNICRSPSALSVTTNENGSVIFGTLISGLIGAMFLTCNVTELGPIKSLGYALSFGIYSKFFRLCSSS